MRWQAASALLGANRDGEAREALGPIAFNPHGGKRRDKAADVLDKLAAGDRSGAQAILAEELNPKEDGKNSGDEDD